MTTFALRLVAVLAVVLGLANPARAETRRIAVLVGHNAGSDGQPALRWAEDDAGKVADVLVQLGDVRPADLFLVQGKGSARVKDAVAAATTAVRAARRAPDDRVVVYFYYSGHSDGTSIELGGERIGYADLKAMLAATGADVRVLIVDACKSGTLVAKGGHPGPAFAVDLVDDLTTRGEAMLTSSAADEQSLESSEIRGSFFTHHLVSGLRGAADTSGDGRITLSEAYEYAFGKTVSASAATGSTPQHPSYDYRLSGRGELVLTDVASRTSVLELPAGFDRALVVALARDQIVAEITNEKTRRVALAPGAYAVRLWRKATVVGGRVAVADGAVATVRWDDLQPIDATHPASKGDAVAAKDDALSPEAQATYDAGMLTFGEDSTLVISDKHAQVVTRYVTYLGKYHKEIELDDFLGRVQRPDLVETYQDRRALKRGMIIGGAVVAGVGIAYGLYRNCYSSPDFLNDKPAFDACSRDTKVALVSGFSGLFVGSVLVIVGMNLRNEPTSPDEMRRLADEYNVSLRAQLRVPREPTAPVPAVTTRPSSIHAHVEPYGAAGGGGAMLVGTF